MIAYQLSVFAENKPGRLAKITGILGREKINIRAITISTSDVFGVINILVDDPRRAHTVLTNEGLTASLKPVIAVLIEDKPGGLDKLIQLLAEEEVNIENAYGFVIESWKNAIFVIDVDQVEKAQELLKLHKFETLNASALQEIEPFHYMKY